MTALPDFRLETYFSKWEFTARYHLTASDAQSMSMADLLAMARPEDAASFQDLWLGYTETWGAPDLRETIAETYNNRVANEILCFAGAEEGIYAAFQTLLEPDAHVITVIPNYQSLETIAQSICDVSGVPLNPDDGWSLDIDRVAAEIRPNTRLIAINFPHNPTGAILPRGKFDALVALCRKHDLYLFSDEVYRPLGPEGTVHLPQVADVYEKGLSLGVMSKAYGLPGLRIGWLACADRELLARIERTKHYLSICNSGPSERLAIIALRSRETILARNRRIVSDNLTLMEEFFGERPDLFTWRRPDGGCVGYPQYLGNDGVEEFARLLVEASGVLVLPSSIYATDLGATPTDRFRVGFGRLGLQEGLGVFRKHLARYYA